ncbi:ribose 5-phosphate isomerase B [Catalinimonas alkaloidigena]|uniref:ribose 5-phosphate isomerase B n=1 Tax=Catalinimonas alkaloidigena TaxID=1075417 RepID=UPI002404DE0E|nr:ribose 5-phosphate isomerase B [Catalinimonas alkaloidigena]MDF9800897.1 ribose 5-phosphate isomerase B [Catalinimonas alkaloidigena]
MTDLNIAPETVAKGIIALGADHAGFHHKQTIKAHLEKLGFKVKDFGTDSSASVDYPDFAHPLAEAVGNGDCNLGILVCGSGNGVAITANKHPQVRAAICWNVELAALARQHNNANVLCVPERFVSDELALEMTDIFLRTDFEGGRHERRVSKISC